MQSLLPGRQRAVDEHDAGEQQEQHAVHRVVVEIVVGVGDPLADPGRRKDKLARHNAYNRIDDGQLNSGHEMRTGGRQVEQDELAECVELVDHVPPVVVKTAEIMKLDAFRQLILLKLPAAGPHLVTGIKLAVVYSVIGIVAGEFILATAGIGKRVSYAYDNFDNNTMYGMLLLLLAGVMLVNGALSAWEKRLHRRFGQR